MKKLIRMACMALVAIAASVTVASCSKSDSGDDFSASALGLVCGFSENIFDNYDLNLTYTDASGKTVTEALKKENGEKEQMTVGTVTYTYYSLSKAITFTSAPANGTFKITATKKSSYSFVDTDKYDLFLLWGYGTVKAGTTKVTVNQVDYNKFPNHNLIGSKVDETISRRFQNLDWSYAVSSDGTIKVTSNSSSTTTE